MPSDDEHVSDDVIWETLPVSLPLFYYRRIELE